VDLDELRLPRRIETILRRHGFGTVEALTAKNPRELLALDGFGVRALSELVTTLTSAGLALTEDPWAPYVCAREGEPRGDAGLASFFLCEDCAESWQAEAFASTQAAYVGERLDGYCLNCNQRRNDIRVRQWFLCGNCERVARSIGRSIVAARAVQVSWDEIIAPRFPQLRLLDVDTPSLYRRTRETIAGRVSSADFMVADARTGETVLALELKTGKSHIGRHGVGSHLAEFQLDTSDCDDILAVVLRERVPVYLVHAQVVDRAAPPTVRYNALGLWWTDLFAMQEHLLRVRRRPRETRMAAYYDPTIFRIFSTFLEYVADGGVERDRRLLRDYGWTVPLYEQST
jgi:hypothetical protein